MNHMSSARPAKTDDGLGPSSDIGAKLRALYSSVQDEGIPERFLDLLEKLDRVEHGARRASTSDNSADGE